MSLLADLRKVYDRELASLADQVQAYDDYDVMWQTPAGISNSAGTLALHMCGNLRHYLGMQIGGTDYVRDRPFEFAGTKVSKDELLEIISATRVEVDAALSALSEDNFAHRYPLEIGGVYLNIGQLVVHLLSHFSYHLGQVDYHRRLIVRENQGVGALSLKKLVGESENL